MSAASGSGSSRGRTGGIVVAAVVAILFVTLWIGTPSDVGPLDPRSHEPDGTSALVALLEELGADVEIIANLDDLTDAGPEEGEGHDVALLLWDQLTPESTAALNRWVSEGNVLVVADPSSELAPLSSSAVFGDEEVEAQLEDLDREMLPDGVDVGKGRCDIGALDDAQIRSVRPVSWPVTYRVTEGAQSCFGSGDEAFIVANARAEGTIVSVGGPTLATNAALGFDDNAPVLAALLAPREGTRVAVLEPDLQGATAEGEETLGDLVSPLAWFVAAQAGLAFVVYALWRARRLGKPLSEPQPVKVASSELVAAVGSLLERSGSAQHAAELLRADLRRDLTRQLGLSPHLSPQQLASVIESRSSLDEGWLHWALSDWPVESDAQLLQVSQAVDVVRKEVLESVGTSA